MKWIATKDMKEGMTLADFKKVVEVESYRKFPGSGFSSPIGTVVVLDDGSRYQSSDIDLFPVQSQEKNVRDLQEGDVLLGAKVSHVGPVKYPGSITIEFEGEAPAITYWANELVEVAF